MNPSDMNSAQLLDATIEAMVEAGAHNYKWAGYAIEQSEQCVLCRAATVIGGGRRYGQMDQDDRVKQWDAAARLLFGYKSVDILALYFPEPENFDDLISKLRQIKAML